MLKQLWMDESGATLSAEIVLIGTILVLGVITGLSSVQSAVVGELADLATAIGSVNQSYSFNGYTAHASSTGNSDFIDAVDFCDVSATDPLSACITVGGTGGNE